jgi:hypothetical protein
MQFDYEKLKVGTVERLIEKFGKSGTLRLPGVQTNTDYNPEPADSIEQPVKVIQTHFKKEDNNGTLVQETDVMFLISTAGVTTDPKMADGLSVEGTLYGVVRIDPLAPGPVVMLWKVHARK